MSWWRTLLVLIHSFLFRLMETHRGRNTWRPSREGINRQKESNESNSSTAVDLYYVCFFFVFAAREEKKKKQKQEACDVEKTEKSSSGGSAVEQASKGGPGPSQQPPKRGQKVWLERGNKSMLDFLHYFFSFTTFFHAVNAVNTVVSQNWHLPNHFIQLINLIIYIFKTFINHSSHH